MIDLSKYKVHDLTHPLGEEVDGFSTTTAKTVEKDGWNASWLRLYSHAGTHMDAPYHFAVNDQTIDDYRPERFLGKAWIARVVVTQGRQRIGVEDLGHVASKVKAGDHLLLQTGWSKRIGQPAYRNELPRISPELARWCVEKKVQLLGVEPPSVADVNNLEEVTEIHQVLLGGGVMIVEGLRDLDRIKQDSVFLMAFPLNILGGDGAPARVIALEAKSE